MNEAPREVCWTVVESSIGRLLVGRTERGICAVMMGEDEAALGEELRRRFPASRLRSDPGLEAFAAQVARLIDRPQLPHAIPLDLRGTDFQRAVWESLRQIPTGATITYSELAERAGRPRAVRAAAAACAANPIAVLVPCHRVVGRDGSLTGYRWGLHRKQSLLAAERKGVRNSG